MDADEGLYHATPQTKGTIAHTATDGKTSSTSSNDILSLPVSSDELGVMGKIDVYKQKEKMLIERKYKLKQIYRGQLYQLWAQYYCMLELGYKIEKLAFYEISTNRMIPIEIPTEEEKNELKEFIQRFRNYNPADYFVPNPNKCLHCIYCNLCDKTEVENVYS